MRILGSARFWYGSHRWYTYIPKLNADVSDCSNNALVTAFTWIGSIVVNNGRPTYDREHIFRYW